MVAFVCLLILLNFKLLYSTPHKHPDQCDSSLDCGRSELGRFCCYEAGVCCSKEVYLKSEKRCKSNVNCPTEAEFYYCCSASKTCCNYEAYEKETESEINKMIAVITCSSFFIIMGSCICIGVWRVIRVRFNTRNSVGPPESACRRRRRRSSSRGNRTPNSSAPYHLRDANINIININGSDGSTQNTYEEQIINGRRILLELPIYDNHQSPNDEVTLDLPRSSSAPNETVALNPSSASTVTLPPRYSPPPEYTPISQIEDDTLSDSQSEQRQAPLEDNDVMQTPCRSGVETDDSDKFSAVSSSGSAFSLTNILNTSLRSIEVPPHPS